MDLTELYREVILDHNRSPRNFGRLEPADATATGRNPLCGDTLDVTLRLDGNRITDLKFEGQGCAISMASASLMSEAVKGRRRDEVEHLFEQIHGVLTGREPRERHDLGKLVALGGVVQFPARVECASLCWHTLQAALANSDAPVSTE